MDDAGRLALALAAARRRIEDGLAAGGRFRAFERLVAALPHTVGTARLPRRVRRGLGRATADPAGVLGRAAAREVDALWALGRGAREAGAAEARAAVREARRHHRETLAGLGRVLDGLEAGVRARNAEARAALDTLRRRGRALHRALRRGGEARVRRAFRAYSSQLAACLETARVGQRAALARLLAADVPALQARLDALDRETAQALRRALLLAAANALDRPARLLAQAAAALGTLAAPACPAAAREPPRPGRRARRAARLAAPDWQARRIEAAQPSPADAARLRALGLLPAPAPPARPASAPPGEKNIQEDE